MVKRPLQLFIKIFHLEKLFIIILLTFFLTLKALLEEACNLSLTQCLFISSSLNQKGDFKSNR